MKSTINHVKWMVLSTAVVLLPGISKAWAYELAPNLLMNGSFEAGESPGGYLTLKPGTQSIGGWQVMKGSIDYIGTYFKASEGGRSIDLDGTPGAGAIQQAFKTTPGHLYRLTFDVSVNPQCAPNAKSLGITVAGVSHRLSNVTQSSSWVNTEYQFVAMSERTTLRFDSLDEPSAEVSCGVLLDNVAVQDITPAQLATFNGQWQTNWGPMDLTTHGRYITGHYEHDQGRIVGMISPDGKSFKGEWSESPSYKPPSDGGLVEFTLDSPGNSMKGRWGYGPTLTGGDWTGTRVTP